MDTENWILKGTKFITNSKKQRLKIQSRGQILKNTILKKKKQSSKSYMYIYMKFALKIDFFAKFCDSWGCKESDTTERLN